MSELSRPRNRFFFLFLFFPFCPSQTRKSDLPGGKKGMTVGAPDNLMVQEHWPINIAAGQKGKSFASAVTLLLLHCNASAPELRSSRCSVCCSRAVRHLGCRKEKN